MKWRLQVWEEGKKETTSADQKRGGNTHGPGFPCAPNGYLTEIQFPWKEKLASGERKVVEDPRGRGLMLIPKPTDLDSLIRRIPSGKLATGGGDPGRKGALRGNPVLAGDQMRWKPRFQIPRRPFPVGRTSRPGRARYHPGERGNALLK